MDNGHDYGCLYISILYNYNYRDTLDTKSRVLARHQLAKFAATFTTLL